jgi:hypothetical protein
MDSLEDVLALEGDLESVGDARHLLT